MDRKWLWFHAGKHEGGDDGRVGGSEGLTVEEVEVYVEMEVVNVFHWKE